MLAKRLSTPTVFAGAMALAALSGCSLQDFDYLGEGNNSPPKDTSSDDRRSTSSEATDSSSSTSAGPDAALSSEPTPTDETSSSEPTAGSTSNSSEVPSEPEPTSAPDPSTVPDETSTREPRPDPVDVPGNLIPNFSFEEAPRFGSGPLQWQPIGPVSLSITTTDSHSGTRSMLVAPRAENWHAPGINVRGVLEPGKSYIARAWARAAESSGFNLVLKNVCIVGGVVENSTNDPAPGVYTPLTSNFSQGTEWVELVTPPFELRACEAVDVVLYIEGPAAGVHLFVDDVSLVALETDTDTGSDTGSSSDTGAGTSSETGSEITETDAP